ncbi:MAG: VCBS repeat-containing protein [Bacteroidota bacterium]|nr:VCBS repeat-containing protein [Bacteroidota bacterium]
MKNIISIATLLITLTSCSFSQTENHNSKRSDKITIPAGKGAASVEIGDFNKDGKPDIAIANIEDSSLTILLNNGNRKFTQAKGSPFFAGHFPNDINIADINEDGNLDIALANHEKKYFTILLGNGKGQFKSAPNSPFAVQVKPHTHGIISADFNNDRNLDVATDSWAVDSIVILNGDGKGNFINPVYYATGKHPYQRLRTADFNKDSNADIVTTNLDDNTVTVLLGDGKGNFRKRFFDAGNVPFGVAIGDLNADGNLDLAIINSPTISGGKSGRDGLTILLGDGKGNFAKLKGSPFETGLGPTRVAIGDLNNDGFNDIAVSNFNSNFISIYYMNKNGLQSSSHFPIGEGSDGLAIFDLDGDGKKDIIATSSNDNNVTIFFGK